MEAVQPTIEEKWEAALHTLPNIGTLPINRDTLCQWVTNAATSINGIASANDQLGIDLYSNGYFLDDNFRPLQGGRLMNALGTNNDCLIHSFLSCLCPSFRKYIEEIRSTIARFFRQFIMIQINDADNDLLVSNKFLETDELSLLCKHFHVQFLLVKRGFYPVDRHLEFFPDLSDPTSNSWRRTNATNRGPFYVIHGSGVHFTPVAWNGNYELTDKTFDQLNQLMLKISREREADQRADLTRRSNTETVIKRLLGQYNLADIKQEIEAGTTKEEKYAILNQSVADLMRGLDRQIEQLDQNEYRRDYARYILFSSIIESLTGEAGNASSNAATTQPSSTSNAATTQSSTFESDLDLEAAIQESIRIQKEKEEQENDAHHSNMAAATAASLVTPNNQNKNLKNALQLSRLDIMYSLQQALQHTNLSIQHNTVPGNSLQSPSRTRPETMEGVILKNGEEHIRSVERSIGNSILGAIGKNPINLTTSGKVLRTLSGITAAIGENSGKYTATVYEPVASHRSNGGKRNTKKAMRVKKQKTKKLKRSK